MRDALLDKALNQQVAGDLGSGLSRHKRHFAESADGPAKRARTCRWMN
jgi:hypothetical protein